MKNHRLFLSSFLLLVLAMPSFAADGLVNVYDKMKADADLIVIATPLSVTDTGEKTVLPGISIMTADSKTEPDPAIGMQAAFTVETVLKGHLIVNRLDLSYLREANPPAQPMPGGPRLVTFDGKSNIRYLMFLKLEKDGSYSAVTGQTDPGLSIKPLGTEP